MHTRSITSAVLILIVSIFSLIQTRQVEGKVVEITGLTDLGWHDSGFENISVYCDEFRGNLIYVSGIGVAVLHQPTACYAGIMNKKRASKEFWQLVVSGSYVKDTDFAVYCDKQRQNLVYIYGSTLSVVHQPETCGAEK